MRAALDEARSAAASGDVPVGAVVVQGDVVLARATNRTVRDQDPTAHAELLAIRAASAALGSWRLEDCTLYVTLEPCAMCAGAMIQARVAKLIYGADDPRGGAVRSCFEVLSHPRLNHRVEIVSGLLADESSALLQSFFAARR